MTTPSWKDPLETSVHQRLSYHCLCDTCVQAFPFCLLSFFSVFHTMHTRRSIWKGLEEHVDSVLSSKPYSLYALPVHTYIVMNDYKTFFPVIFLH